MPQPWQPAGGELHRHVRETADAVDAHLVGVAAVPVEHAQLGRAQAEVRVPGAAGTDSGRAYEPPGVGRHRLGLAAARDVERRELVGEDGDPGLGGVAHHGDVGDAEALEAWHAAGGDLDAGRKRALDNVQLLQRREEDVVEELLAQHNRPIQYKLPEGVDSGAMQARRPDRVPVRS